MSFNATLNRALELASSSPPASTALKTTLQRAPANHIGHEGQWVHVDSPLGRSLMGVSECESTPVLSKEPLPSPPPIQRGPRSIMMVHGVPDSVTRNILPELKEEDNLMDRLSSLRSRLQIRQDALLSNEEVYDDLANKISAIEGVLSAFNVIFRTR